MNPADREYIIEKEYVLKKYGHTARIVASNADNDTAKLPSDKSPEEEYDRMIVCSSLEARKKTAQKLPSFHAITELLYPNSLCMEQCSSEATARYKASLFGRDELCADLTGGLGVDTYFISRQCRKVDYFEKDTVLSECAAWNFIALGADNITVYNREVDALSITANPETGTGHSHNSHNSHCRNHDNIHNSHSNCHSHCRNHDNIHSSHSNCRNHDNIHIPRKEPAPYTTIYLDPARRDKNSKRVYGISDCTPDLTAIKEHLFAISGRIIAKLSPMIDIRDSLEKLPETKEVHIISVKNECKELLFVLEPGNIQDNGTGQETGSPDNYSDYSNYCNIPDTGTMPEDVPLITVNIESPDNRMQTYKFTLKEESEAMAKMTDSRIMQPDNGGPTDLDSNADSNADSDAELYIYEPNKSIIKGGAFRKIASDFGLSKPDNNTHLYFSDRADKEFPGKIYKVEGKYRADKKSLHILRGKYGSAEITTKNFPATSEEIRKKLKMKDGGEIHLFITKYNGNTIIFASKRV